MTCNCDYPILTLDHHHEIWCACGHEPREDLGPDRDPMERVKYRAMLNRLRGQIPTPQDYQSTAPPIDFKPERKPPTPNPRPCVWCGEMIEHPTANRQTTHEGWCRSEYTLARDRERRAARRIPCVECGAPTTSGRCQPCAGKASRILNRERVADLYRDGRTLQEIAVEVGAASPNAVSALIVDLRKQGVDLPNRYQRRAA